jgi:predicted nuclease of predicted toxin-antitoxin system
LDAKAVRNLGLRDAEDKRIFDEARIANSVVLTKDSDFVRLLERYGPPPKIILLTCGNTSNANLKVILDSTLRDAIKLLNGGEELVEIR